MSGKNVLHSSIPSLSCLRYMLPVSNTLVVYVVWNGGQSPLQHICEDQTDRAQSSSE